MSHIDEVVDQVIAAFNARRRTRWSMTGLSPTGPRSELAHFDPMVKARLEQFRQSMVDRDELARRARARYQGAEWTADFRGVADELQEMSREDLRRFLTDNGMPPEAAQEVAQGYSVGALLHESES